MLVEDIDEEREAAVGSEVEGGFGLVVFERGVGSELEQQTAEGDVAFDGGEHQERPAVLVDEVWVEAGGEGGAESGLVSALD